jgi:alpha-beta hydrolase superfamily lysophospholipase
VDPCAPASGWPRRRVRPGAGSFGLDFLLVHQLVAEQTTSLLYDCAGTGWSDDVDLPRSIGAVTDELRDLVHVREVPGPYLLVGHSLGGAYVQRYAQRFPADVSGLLLLDPLHEDWDDHMPPHLRMATNAPPPDAQMPDLPEEVVDQLRGMLLDTMSGFPEPLRDVIVAKHASHERLPVGFREGLNVVAVMDDLRRGGRRPGVPVTILGAGGIDAQQLMFSTEDRLREQIRGSQRLYAAMAAAPGWQHTTVADASHATLPMARPDAVAHAVADLLGRIERAGR